MSMETVEVVFHGPGAKIEVRGKATNTFYGRRQNGDRLRVRVEDYRAEPYRFEAVDSTQVLTTAPAAPASSGEMPQADVKSVEQVLAEADAIADAVEPLVEVVDEAEPEPPARTKKGK